MSEGMSRFAAKLRSGDSENHKLSAILSVVFAPFFVQYGGILLG